MVCSLGRHLRPPLRASAISFVREVDTTWRLYVPRVYTWVGSVSYARGCDDLRVKIQPAQNIMIHY